MSIRALSLTWEAFEGSGGELLLALALADFADDDGASIYPSVARLARKTRRSRRAVQLGLRRLEARGWLERVAEAGTARASAVYRINPAWMAAAR